MAVVLDPEIESAACSIALSNGRIWSDECEKLVDVCDESDVDVGQLNQRCD